MVISTLEAMEGITALAANATLPKKRWLMANAPIIRRSLNISMKKIISLK